MGNGEEALLRPSHVNPPAVQSHPPPPLRRHLSLSSGSPPATSPPRPVPVPFRPFRPASLAAMSVTFHTTHGDIKVEIFCEAVPKTAENFLALCASGYYDNCLWHRNIKGFMIQTGDPSGSGKGGQSIWGKPFSDEIRSTLKFNNRGILAMANSGPDTNKSQFFITYAKQPHLDGKYTIFGKACVSGCLLWSSYWPT
ncbi:hypothetical protein ONZ51_g9806 [Trametes cubensis]|uniref:Peptidyl-prolyl cis-trans isomerase n=1 Tax=Trametes cubensis TaxID=1111947 RepID=A0AAD7TMI4_9APHY|nr:hypothetical protein ONZ51_g9806 [Trametes cubensis]